MQIEEFTIHNCRMTDVGGLRQGGLGAEPPAFDDFYDFFNENNTFYVYLGLNSCLKIFS